MKFTEVAMFEEVARLRELGPAPMATTTTQQPAVSGQTPAPGAAPAQPARSGQPIGGLDPAQAAQAAKQRADQKKQLQDQIKQTEQTLNNLRKQMAELG